MHLKKECEESNPKKQELSPSDLKLLVEFYSILLEWYIEEQQQAKKG